MLQARTQNVFVSRLNTYVKYYDLSQLHTNMQLLLDAYSDELTAINDAFTSGTKVAKGTMLCPIAIIMLVGTQKSQTTYTLHVGLSDMRTCM